MRLEAIAPTEAAFEVFERRIAEAGLRVEELHAGLARYFALRSGEEEPSAFGGLLALADEAMLQSVVVAPQSRGAGLGAALVEALSQEARAAGARRLWLLTLDAADFFGRMGFAPAERAEAPPVIAATMQFRDLCPHNAVLMCRKLA